MSPAAAGDLVVLSDAASVAQHAAAWLGEAITQAVTVRGRADVALAGGTTPAATYRQLAAHALPWASVHFWFGDERCVPAAHPEANARMAHDMLGPALAAGATLHVMDGGGDGEGAHAAAAAAYAAALPQVLDVLVLGMGEDGHTASLFPGHAATSERTARVVAITGAPKPPPERLTITSVVIDAARAVLVLVTGGGKADALAQVVDGPRAPARWPAQLARGPRALWLIDRAAAAQLAPRGAA